MSRLKEVLYSNLKTMKVEDYNKYLAEYHNGYININKHPEDDNIVILNYTEQTTFERRWNEQTMSARGLILDLTYATNNGIVYILSEPFDKFFNYGENLDYEKDIDFSKIESAMEKMDGSMGTSYFFNDELRFATRGSFISEQAIKATEIWRKKYSHKNVLSNAYIYMPSTIIVEIIYPENRIVVNYDGMEDLVLLGIRTITDEFPTMDYGYAMLEQLAKWIDMPMAKQYSLTLEEMLDKKKSLPANDEGWVLKFTNGKRLKIKGDEYIKIHKVIHGLSDKAKVQAWQEGRMKEYVMMLPEEFRPELEKFADDLDRLKDTLYVMLQATFEFILEENTDQKSFALKVQDVIAKEFQGFMFEAKKKGSVSVDSIRQYIYKNYIDYIEVIRTWNNNDL
jgi:RNA ligase